MTRRTLFHSAAGGALAGGLLAHGRQSSRKALSPADVLPRAEMNRKLKVVYVGAHVDDWGTCAGTLARYARDGT